MIQEFKAAPFFVPDSEELRYLPEGPHVLRNCPGPPSLGWVAIQHGDGLRYGSMNVLDLATRVNVSHVLPGRPGFFAETSEPGVVLVGLERRLVYLDLRTGAVEETGASLQDDESVIINDGLAVDGGVLFGTKHLEFNRPIAALYHFDPRTNAIRTVIGGQTCSNGKVLRSDGEGATLIDIDSTPKTITRYRMDADLRTVLDSSLVVSPDSLPAYPDGMRSAPACDGAGEGESVIVAFFNPGAVADGEAWQIRISDGEVLCRWVVPGAPRVTCPEFVERDGQVKLLFTTALEGMAPEIRALAPMSGSIFIADTPFLAMPANGVYVSR